MRALIVDDDFYSRSFLEYILHAHAECDTVENGEEAVMMVQKALDENNPYDLICLDLLMPVIDGPSALAEIREIEKDFGIPAEKRSKIIVTSVLEDDDETHDAMYLGTVASFLQKPIEEKAILAEMRRLDLIPKE
ncbi:response regulator [Desulfovibrio inopinatus]|uniref:response regulator n=1 Tax=Desulfovibrio inopinatus TaxID=102109 RepID=UPI0003FBCA19|nr:response regulator [Desulfovibrio inopinatus]